MTDITWRMKTNMLILFKSEKQKSISNENF